MSRRNQSTLPFALFLLICCFCPASPLLATQCTFSCPHGQIHFTVELAQTLQERAQGLMHRKTLGEDAGMLFISPEPSATTMWMKNTPLSLDMIFMNQKGEILAIEENTTPYSLKIIGPVENTIQVLEIRGGTAQKKGLSKACTMQPLEP